MSDTSKTKARRRRKQASSGKDRKKQLERDGSTPKFPIHPDASTEPAKSSKTKEASKPKKAPSEPEAEAAAQQDA